jgi:hypothetical protein
MPWVALGCLGMPWARPGLLALDGHVSLRLLWGCLFPSRCWAGQRGRTRCRGPCRARKGQSAGSLHECNRPRAAFVSCRLLPPVLFFATFVHSLSAAFLFQVKLVSNAVVLAGSLSQLDEELHLRHLIGYIWILPEPAVLVPCPHQGVPDRIRNLFARGLRNMPRDYIARIVFDLHHRTLCLCREDEVTAVPSAKTMQPRLRSHGTLSVAPGGGRHQFSLLWKGIPGGDCLCGSGAPRAGQGRARATGLVGSSLGRVIMLGFAAGLWHLPNEPHEGVCRPEQVQRAGDLCGQRCDWLFC